MSVNLAVTTSDAHRVVVPSRPVDIRLWLPLVVICLVINLFGLHQATGTWCALAVSVLFIFFVVRDVGLFSALTIVLFVSVLYGMAPAYDIFHELGVSFIDRSIYVDSFLPILVLYVSALAFGYRQVRGDPCARSGQADSGYAQRAAHPDHGRRYFLLLALSAGYFLASVDRYGLVTGEFSRSDIYQANNLGLQIVRSGIVYGAMFGFLGLRDSTPGSAGMWRNRAIWIGSLLLYVYVDLMIFGDRRIFLSAIIAMLVAARLKTATVLWIVVLGTPVVALFWIYSFLRGLPIDTWPILFAQLDWQLVLNLANGEFGGWTRIASDLLGAPFHEVQQYSALKAPFSLIPSAIFPDRPLAPSLWYVQTFDPQTASIGGGWGFALPLEGYLNGWYLGPVLFGMAIGALLGWMERRGGMLQMLAVFVFCFSFRSDVVSLLQQGLLTAAFVIVYQPGRFLGLSR